MTLLVSPRVTSCSKMCIDTLRIAIDEVKYGSSVGGGASWPNTSVALCFCACTGCAVKAMHRVIARAARMLPAGRARHALAFCVFMVSLSFLVWIAVRSRSAVRVSRSLIVAASPRS